MNKLKRRDFIKLCGLGGAVFASGLAGCATGARGGRADNFYFMQISDTHWGFHGPKINPDADGTLKKAVAQINALDQRPDFIVFTGDLTHTTDDVALRRTRMTEFREIVAQLKVKNLKFMPGEHDAALDRGAVYQEFFGSLYSSFDHKGVHFVMLDNVSDPAAALGDEQIAWLRADLARLAPATPIVILAHRPLFDLHPQWDWATRDGAAAVDVLMPYPHVTVFYGHIHQEHHHMTGHIAHHSAKSLIFPLPAPGAAPKRAPIPWDEAAPYRGIGMRNVEAKNAAAEWALNELPIKV